MSPAYVLLLAFLVGVFDGLRSLTPPAVTAWAGRLGWLKLRSPLSWLGTTPAAVIFTALALFELVNDKLPKTPSRTAPPGLITRIVMSAFTGACITTAANPTPANLILGAIVGIVGALVGTFGGYHARKGLDKALGTPDYVIGVIEDLIAIGGSLWVVSRF